MVELVLLIAFTIIINIMIVWEISYSMNSVTRHIWNLARKKLWHEKTIWSGNNSAYMIFLAYRYV